MAETKFWASRVETIHVIFYMFLLFNRNNSFPYMAVPGVLILLSIHK